MSDIDGLVDEVFGDLITDEDQIERAERGGRLSRPRVRPERVTSTTAVLESADLDIRTCQHEIAFALATLAGHDVELHGLPVHFEFAARKFRQLIRDYPRCQLKGAS